MATFSPTALDQLGDAAEVAFYEGRADGLEDWDTRERFLQAAATAFDVAAEPPYQDATRQDAQP